MTLLTDTIDSDRYTLELAMAREAYTYTFDESLELAITFNPADHPRDWKGKFREVLGALKVGEHVDLPGGAKVRKVKRPGNRPDALLLIKGDKSRTMKSSRTALTDIIHQDPSIPTPGDGSSAPKTSDPGSAKPGSVEELQAIRDLKPDSAQHFTPNDDWHDRVGIYRTDDGKGYTMKGATALGWIKIHPEGFPKSYPTPEAAQQGLNDLRRFRKETGGKNGIWTGRKGTVPVPSAPAPATTPGGAKSETTPSAKGTSPLAGLVKEVTGRSPQEVSRGDRFKPKGAVNPHGPAAPVVHPTPAAAPRTTSSGGTGRSDTGKLRNFASMNDTKLAATIVAVLDENDDHEAMDALAKVAKLRGKYNSQRALERSAEDLRNGGGSSVAARVARSAVPRPKPATKPATPPLANTPSTNWPSEASIRANPGLYHGRGSSGRLRNFKAMNDEKFTLTARRVMSERDDLAALRSLHAEAKRRGHKLADDLGRSIGI